MLSTDFVPGAPNWVDLATSDVDAAIAFYGALFGWTHVPAGPDGGGYGFFQLDGRTVAGIGPVTDPGGAPSWTLYFDTRDADATSRAVEQAGGTVRFGPHEVSTAGRMVGFTDPTGAPFAVWQPGDIVGLDAVTVPNTLCWTELYTTDAGAAKAFYRSVFGWELRDAPMPGVTYTVASPTGGGQEASHGGIMQLPEENQQAGTTSAWHPYFEVDDCDATVAAAAQRGATVVLPPHDAEGVGRLALLVDPFGALFALITSTNG